MHTFVVKQQFTTIQGVPNRKLLKSLIVKIWMPYEKAERNDAYNIDKVHVLKFR